MKAMGKTYRFDPESQELRFERRGKIPKNFKDRRQRKKQKLKDQDEFLENKDDQDKPSDL